MLSCDNRIKKQLILNFHDQFDEFIWKGVLVLLLLKVLTIEAMVLLGANIWLLATLNFYAELPRNRLWNKKLKMQKDLL